VSAPEVTAAAVLAEVADGLRVTWLVVDNLAADVAAEPGMEAAEVLRRLRNVLPAVPTTPEETR
jgi:hypothetical protein